MSAGAQFSEIDTENARCGIEYCESDLCNYPRNIPMSTGAPDAALNESKCKRQISRRKQSFFMEFILVKWLFTVE